ncbi:Microsomal glutathione S-transferase 3 [Psilocybe cubensis]|uniref:Microsomal glutathione S-transferase 3 n=2 Tax=Psilocybe cubensis TaxID=181762 RepID=A0A8H8CPE6_PSICU|nr:Microsomal glutathione S-transferase 3 [Psilocybe cubensis]KAH9484591.1 Microsomal glutathione S-transferase 3 [Psilocybe cubensis]
MSVTVTIPEDFKYVGASLFLTAVLLQGLASTVGRYRKLAKIEYPQMYAEKKEMEESREALLFNCAQRAHHNAIEYVHIAYVTTIISGLRFPIPSAIACAFWCVSRVSYARGYLTGDPKKVCGGTTFEDVLTNLFVSLSAVPSSTT